MKVNAITLIKSWRESPPQGLAVGVRVKVIHSRNRALVEVTLTGIVGHEFCERVGVRRPCGHEGGPSSQHPYWYTDINLNRIPGYNIIPEPCIVEVLV